jgi:hypothetical protein
VSSDEQADEQQHQNEDLQPLPGGAMEAGEEVKVDTRDESQERAHSSASPVLTDEHGKESRNGQSNKREGLRRFENDRSNYLWERYQQDQDSKNQLNAILCERPENGGRRQIGNDKIKDA